METSEETGENPEQQNERKRGKMKFGSVSN